MSEVIEQKTAMAFGRRNTNDERIKQEEAELAELNNKASEEENKEPTEAEPTSAEEKTFKKRYGDLRRHSQQKEADLQKQLDEIKTQLNAATKQQFKLPKTEAELTAWAREYPDVYKIVQTIAAKQVGERATEFEERFKKLDEREKLSAREKAETELLQAHPDFGAIRDDDSFHEWVEDQPKYIQDALYNNDTDSKAASRAIDLYKADKGISTTKKKDTSREAAMNVGIGRERTKPSSTGKEGMLYESEVERMSSKEYEARAVEIQAAMQAGKFVYDVSGSAR